MVSIIGINNGIKEFTAKYQNDQSNFDIWWVSQGEKIFVYPNYSLSLYHSKDTKTKEFLIGLKVLAWYIHLMISTKNILKFPYPNTCNKNVEILIIDA